MKLHWPIEAFQLALIAAMFAAAAAVWPHLPDQIAVHWNLQGEADGYGGKARLLFVPLTMLGLYALMLLIPRLDPGYRNYATFATVYAVIRVSLAVAMAGLFAITTLVALGYRVDVGLAMRIGAGVLFVVMGNFMGKIRPNWFVGVRTPWTLSSKLSWTKTHRLAGWLFMALGAMLAASGILRSDMAVYATMGFAAASLVWLVVYSYLVFRHDPERTTPAGTSPGPE